MAWYHVMPTWRLLALPLFTALANGRGVGVGLWLAALNVKYRDFRYVIPFIVQFGFFVSPVGFSSDDWSETGERRGATVYQLYPLNPMDGVINGFRWAIRRQAAPLDHRSACRPWTGHLIRAAGVHPALDYFRSTEKTFADII